MSDADKKKDVRKDDAGKSSGHISEKRQDKTEKRPWSHVIDKDSYSNGPGDNIYVFG